MTIAFFLRKKFLESASTWVEGEFLTGEQAESLRNGFRWSSDELNHVHKWYMLSSQLIPVNNLHITFLEKLGVKFPSAKLIDYL